MALQIEVAQARCLSRCFCLASEVEAQCWKPSTVADWRGIYLEVYLEKKVGGASWLFVARSEAARPKGGSCGVAADVSRHERCAWGSLAAGKKRNKQKMSKTAVEDEARNMCGARAFT